MEKTGDADPILFHKSALLKGLQLGYPGTHHFKTQIILCNISLLTFQTSILLFNEWILNSSRIHMACMEDSEGT
jgi:hypothetical protein